MLTTLIFLIVLAVLIFVHELGHFLAARASGIRVDAFKIGFGPRLIHWKRGDTEYGVNLIPFGGFVKIHGENPDEESTSGADAHRSFATKPRWKQVIVLASGVLFNFIFAWLIYSVVFMAGVTATSDSFGTSVGSFSNERIMITLISPGSPADKAGLKEGDVLPGTSIEAIQNEISDSMGSQLAFEYMRNGETKTVDVTPVTGLVADKYAIGIAMDEVGDLHFSFFSAIGQSFRYTLIMIKGTAAGLYGFVASIFHGTANLSDVSGPVGIAGIVGNAASLGFTYLLMITALISINLGVINVIPFPALDGGRILFVLIEGIIRRRISPRFTNTVNAVGFGLLMILMIVVTWKDVARLIK